jgi:hypothetical protein
MDAWIAGVEGEDVGLVGNVVDQADDVTDLLGRLTEALDPLRVSWICSRMLSMPVMVLCTTSLPLLAMATERSATAEDSEAFADTWSMDGHLVDRRGGGDFLGLVLDASARCIAVAWVSWAARRPARRSG